VQLVPVGDIGLRKTLLACTAMSFTPWLVFRWMKTLIPSTFFVSRMTLWLTLGLLISVGLSGLAVAQATRPELYALAVALTLGSIVLGSDKSDVRKTYTAWFLWGFAFATHPVIAISALPFLVSRNLFAGLMFGALAGLVFLYLPIRSSVSPAWDFGEPEHWSRFLWFVKADLYKAYDSSPSVYLLQNMRNVGALLSESLTLGGAIVGGFGAALIFCLHRSAGVRLVLALTWSWLHLI